MEIKKIAKSPLFKSFVAYTMGGALSSAVPFFLLPVLTRYLTPEDYGFVATFQAILVVTMPFVGVNLDGAIARS